MKTFLTLLLSTCGLFAQSNPSNTMATVVFGMTNAFGRPDTNYFRVQPIQNPVLANGGIITRGIAWRMYPDTNGVTYTNLLVGWYQMTNSFLNQGVIFEVPQNTNSYSVNSLARSGFNTYEMTGVLGLLSSDGTIGINPVNGVGFVDVSSANTTNGHFTNIVVQNITNNSFVTTNVTINFPGGFTNLNLIPNSLMYSDANDAESSLPNAIGVLTNNGVGAIGWTRSFSLDELDANNAYLTNTFTFITNAQYLKTDGDGKLINGTGLPATNLLLSAGANIAFTTNSDGTIVIAGSGTAVINTVTNNTFVNTNVFISTSNAYFNNLYATNTYFNTNFSTNLYIVSGKGNTLIITNNLQLQYLTASKLVASDGAKNLTNADVTARLSFSGNVLDLASVVTAGSSTKPSFDIYGRVTSSGTATLASSDFANQGTTTTVLHGNASGNPSWGSVVNNDLANSSITIQGSAVALGGSTLAAGSAPFFDLSSSTNLIYRYTTNSLTAITMTFGKSYTTNVSSSDITFTAINAQDLAAFETCVLFATNSSGSDHKITFPNGIGSAGLGLPPVITVTNKQSCWIYIQHYGNQATNIMVNASF